MTDLNFSLFPTVKPTITAGAYSAGDVVGGLLTFDAGLTVSTNLILHRLIIGDADNEKAAFDVWFFNAAPTTIADNAAFSTISDAEIRDTCFAHMAVATSDYTTAGSNALGEVNVNKEIKTDASGKFYAYVVCSGTPTYGTTGDLRFTVAIWPDHN
jgi:hypothetical protein